MKGFFSGEKFKEIAAQSWKWLRAFASTKKGKFTIAFLITGIVWWFSVPSQLFDDPTSTVLLDRNGKLLGARIAKDGQWRFPDRTSVPYKFSQCLIQFEDRQFYNHPGVS